MEATTDQAGIERPSIHLGPAEHSLLGLLACADGDGVHGYDLTREYSHGALGEIIRLESGMLYHHLKKLGRYGLITTSIERQTDRPDRQIHVLTRSGMDQLHHWLAEPVQATREIRLDFLLKLVFTRRLDPCRLSHLILEQRSVLARRIASLEAQSDAPTSREDVVERQMILRLRRAQTLAALDWLDSLRPMEDAT